MKLLKEKETFSINDHIENFFNLEQDENQVIEHLFITKQPNWWNIFFSNYNNKIDNNLQEDLDIFTKTNLFSKIDKTKTIYGKYILQKLLKNPSNNLTILNNRTNFIKMLTNKNYDLTKLNNLIDKIKNYDKSFLWFWRNNDEHSDFIYNMIYFQTPYLQFLNKNEMYLRLSNFYKIVISPLFVTFSPLIYIILPFVILRFLKIRLPFKTLVKMIWGGSQSMTFPFIKNKFMQMAINLLSKGLSIFYYFQNVYNTITTSKNTVSIIKTMHEKISTLSKLVNINEEFTSKHENFVGNTKTDEQQNYFGNMLKDIHLLDIPTIVSDKGVILSTFYNVLESKNNIIPYLMNLGLLDAFSSLANLYQTSKNKLTRYSFPNYQDFKSNGEKIHIDIKNLWHLALYDKNSVILNSINFDDKNRNYIITGPNAAGKSTFIKSVLLNVYLSQTITLANCDEINITPLHLVSSCIKATDEQGSESLFQAEMHRAKYYLDTLQELEKDQLSLTVFDEMFTSTNYLEGMVAANTVCEELGKIKNSLCLVTTHFTKIASISKKKKYCFNSLHFIVDRDINNKIIFPYKLEKGISTQYIALELMKENGFNDKFIDRALYKIKKLASKDKKYITQLTERV